ncbi:MAG: hypothetical protein IPI60_00290 [Saprospiraceae bacterium]|nr:hypothetical protein [Saprospiraceae bacterium]
MFQNELSLSTENVNLIVPYKERVLASDTDEEKELNLLYRKKRVFSIGHGTSVQWETRNDETTGYETVSNVWTSVIPEYDLRQVAPTAHVTLSMFELSDLGNWVAAKESLIELRNDYQSWILKLEASLNSKELKDYRGAATRNIEKCKVSLNRISKGIELLLNAAEDSDLVKCFRWMNRAMMWQQQRSKAKIRKWEKTGAGTNQSLILEYLDEETKSQDFESLEKFHEGKYNGKWRPFNSHLC